jgi:hypothetical protein
LFGAEIGGFWLKADQINQLRTLPDCYPATEIEFVRRAIDAYIEAQIKDLHRSTKILSSVEILCRDKPLAIDQPGKLQSGRIG